MKKGFEIILKNEKLKLYQRLNWLIVLLNFLFFLYLAFFAVHKPESDKSIALLVLLAIFYALHFYFRNTKYQFGHQLFFLIILFGWIGLERYWFAGVQLVLTILSSIATRKFIVVFTESAINYPSFPPTSIYWSQLNNVILKDGILTLDFKNNKLIQQNIDESHTKPGELEFNEFCRQQLHK